MDASLGPGSAVRGNGKKRGEIAKKKKIGERSHHFPFPDYCSPRSTLLSFILRLFHPLRGRVQGYVDAHDGFLVLIRKDTRWFNQSHKAKATLSLSYIIVSLTIDWLGKPADIKVENNGAVVYVESSLTVHNPLFFVHKLWLNKLMRCFYWSVSSKW